MAERNLIRTLNAVASFKPEERLLFSANHDDILCGATTDVYFVRAYEVLRHVGRQDTAVVAEIFASGPGVCAGVEECLNLLRSQRVQVWALDEGLEFGTREVLMRIQGSYGEFGIYETALLGILASSSAWATAARECKAAAGDKQVLSFGARHVHPSVASVMDRAAIVGGADGCSSVLGAALLGRPASGTIPHAAALIVGDTVEVARAYDESMPSDTPRVILVDTFKDEAEETLRVAGALRNRLQGVRLDTPSERGGVTTELVRETRARLDQAGYRGVQIFVSGGLNPARIADLARTGADGFGVGSYISSAKPIDMTMDLKAVEGRPVAKRGRIPGLTPAPRLRQRL